MWLPQDSESHDADEEGEVNYEPTDQEGRELKQMFIEHASEKYKRNALSPEAILARRMYLYLKDGVCTMEDMGDSKDIIQQ